MKLLHPDKREKVIAGLLAFFSAWLLFPFFFDAAVYPVPSSGPSWLTLDPSWKIAINKANIDRLIWGEDFVLTYGPLSYLSTRIGWGTSRYSFLLFDVFFFINFFIIFYKSYLKSQDKRITVLLIAASSFLLPLFFGAGTSIILFAFLIFWLVESLESNKIHVYIMQTIILLLLFFIKFNTGLISILLFVLCIMYKLVFQSGNRFLLVVYLLLPFMLVFPAAGLLNVSLRSYISGALEMVSGYNEIMYLNEPYQTEFYFAIAIISSCGALFYYIVKYEEIERKKLVFIACLFAVSVFVLYKQAFTRMDIQHIREFYSYFLLLLLCFQVFHVIKLNENSRAIIIGIVFFTVFFAKKRDDNFLNIDKSISKADYISGFSHFTDTSGMHLSPNTNLLPEYIKSKIAGSSIDIYPWNAHLLLENKLNYKSRPVFQSYMTYTPYLQNLNFNYYNSAKAPEFVIYDFDGIDGRYPLFDDAKLNLVLLNKYTCADTFSFSGRKQLLLQKNKNSKNLKLQIVKQYELQIEDSIIPKKGHFYEIQITKNLKGQLASIFLPSPEINTVIVTKDGNKHAFRTSVKLLQAGIFSKYYFASTFDVYQYMKSQDRFSEANKIAHIRFEPVQPSYFDKSIIIKAYKIELN